MKNDIFDGFSITVNRGIFLSNSEWVIVLNNDVKLSKEYISILMSEINDNSIFSVCGKTENLITNENQDGSKPVCGFIGGRVMALALMRFSKIEE